jgi:sirohydrochlorin cobaltochelatase
LRRCEYRRQAFLHYHLGMSSSPVSSRRAILLFAHGSSDPAWAAPFESILTQVRAQTAQPVALAYLERMQPSMNDAVAALAASGVTDVTLVPLFLAVGGHMRNDLPGMVRDAEAQNGVKIHVRQTIGESPDMTAQIAQWAIGQAAA